MTTCPYVCNNKTSYGYCCSTVCINPLYNQRTINGGLMADYVQIVRCKDCKWQGDDEHCPFCNCCGRETLPNGEWYCARGEREEDPT